MDEIKQNQSIAGRFHLVDETDDAKVVGLLGGLFYHDLTSWQKGHILAFYMLPGHSCEYLEDYPVTINRSTYTGFIRISK